MSEQGIERWQERYRTGDTPWDSGREDRGLFYKLDAQRIGPCKALEVGCGTGSNAIHLALRGFEVCGLDASELAVETARRRAQEAGASAEFHLLDFMTDAPPGEGYGLVYDRGCFHCHKQDGRLHEFAARVAGVLAEGGHWVSLAGNADGPDREPGPPQLSALEIASAAEPHFELLSLETAWFESDQADPPRSWIVLMRKR